MEASTRKILFPMIIAFVACLVVTAVILGPGRPVEEPKKTAAPPAESLAEVQSGLPVAAEEPSSAAAP